MLTNHPRIRLGLYLAAVACSFIAPFVAVGAPDYAAAFVTGASVLNVAALGTAATNINRKVDLSNVDMSTLTWDDEG